MALHCIPRVKGCVKPQNSLRADSASIRPNYIFWILLVVSLGPRPVRGQYVCPSQLYILNIARGSTQT
jgi:hypothetical protein